MLAHVVYIKEVLEGLETLAMATHEYLLDLLDRCSREPSGSSCAGNTHSCCLTRGFPLACIACIIFH